MEKIKRAINQKVIKRFQEKSGQRFKPIAERTWTPFGNLKPGEAEILEKFRREFVDLVEDGDIHHYEKVRNLFANPEKYCDRRR